MIGICEQLQLVQVDGTPPLSADIQSNPISVSVVYDYMWSSRKTWNLTVPASGIVTLTVPVPVHLANSTISMTVDDTYTPFNCDHYTDEVDK